MLLETERRRSIEEPRGPDEVAHTASTVSLGYKGKRLFRGSYVAMVLSSTMYIPRLCISSITVRQSSIVPKCGSRREKSTGCLGVSLLAMHGVHPEHLLNMNRPAMAG